MVSYASITPSTPHGGPSHNHLMIRSEATLSYNLHSAFGYVLQAAMLEIKHCISRSSKMPTKSSARGWQRPAAREGPDSKMAL